MPHHELRKRLLGGIWTKLALTADSSWTRVQHEANFLAANTAKKSWRAYLLDCSERQIEVHTAVVTRTQLLIVSPAAGYGDLRRADAQRRNMGAEAHRGDIGLR